MRTRSTLAMAGAAALGLSGAPVMAAPATTSASEPSLAWALPHFAVGRQVGWLLSAAPKAPLPVKEIKQHFDKTFLAQIAGSVTLTALSIMHAGFTLAG